MTTYLHRCMIVPAAVVATCRLLTVALEGTAGSNMFVVPLSATGVLPATHYISAGLQETTICDMLPLTSFDGAGVPSTTPGLPDLVTTLAQQAGMVITNEQVRVLLIAMELTAQSWIVALERKQLKLIQVALP